MPKQASDAGTPYRPSWAPGAYDLKLCLGEALAWKHLLGKQILDNIVGKGPNAASHPPWKGFDPKQLSSAFYQYSTANKVASHA